MRLETVLRGEEIRYEKSTHKPTFTSQGPAAVDHVSRYRVAKPVVVKGSCGYAICVVPACAKVDLELVAEVLQEFDVRLASEEEMGEVFPDCELGAAPPIGKLFGLKTITDEQLHRYDEVVMQAGSHTESVKIRREDWERLTKPIVADIASHAS